MAFIIRKDCPPDWKGPPLYLQAQYRLGLAITTEFGRKEYAKRFESLQEAERIIETMVVGSSKLTIESFPEPAAEDKSHE